MDLRDLLDRCRDGDELAWEALVRTYQGRVYGLAYHYMRDHEAARDLAQEIFVKVYRNLPDLEGHEMFLRWMLRIGRNLCIDHLRRARVRPPAEDLALEEGPELAAGTPGPEESWMADSDRRLVHRALGRLSEKNREMILLKEIQGMNLEEIADLLDLPIGTVKSRSNRARLELARAVVALGGRPS